VLKGRILNKGGKRRKKHKAPHRRDSNLQTMDLQTFAT